VSAPACFINDRLIPLSEASVPVTDLGLQRGYGIFDFLRVTDHVPLFWDDHLDRFFHSAEMMRLPVGKTKEALKTVIREMIRVNDLPHSGIKILLTGGASPDGYSLVQPNLVIIQQSITPPPETIFLPGYTLATYAHQRQLPEVKTTDYLIAIRLQPWLKEKGADDILYHQNGMVSECPRSNFFIVTQNNTLVTPAKNILRGITRKQLIGIADEINIAVEERDISMNDIREAKEAFITSSTRRLLPVIQVDEIMFNAFSEDSVTAKLYNAFCQWELSAIRRYQ
jgi:branched-chain amino acid aminotransferase